MKVTKAYAPASMGNLSLGFDVLGAALAPVSGELLGDVVEVSTAQHFSLQVTGKFADKLPPAIDSNIVTRCYQHFMAAAARLDKDLPPLQVCLHKNLPIGSGLGSSASSIVAAFHAFNMHFDAPFDTQALLHMMAALEGEISGSGHSDNVAPCYLGGITLMTGAASPATVSLPVPAHWYAVVCYSGISVSTAAARKILPAQYAIADCLTFGRQLALFVHALHSGDHALALAQVNDVIAEPYRQSLLPGYAAARSAALAAGAGAFGISGSGPTVFALCAGLETAQAVEQALATAYICNADGFSHVCQIPPQGAVILSV